MKREISFCWKNISVSTKPGWFERKTKQILDNVSGYVNKGELVAVMGPAAAGKSTLFHSLVFQNTSGLLISGERYANGVKMAPKGMTGISGFIPQHDLFIGSLTVKEHLMFLANLKLSRRLTKREREDKVDGVINQLGLRKCASTLIGIRGRIKGISGGEMRRLSFASEVISDPPLLFCDEPTSGLDSWMAENIVDLMDSMAQRGTTILCVIHQPSSEIYHKFHRLLLLAEGRMAFMGDVNEGKKFFERIGYPCPTDFNPADHFIYKLSMVPKREDEYGKRLAHICDSYAASTYATEVEKEVEAQVENLDGLFDNEDFDPNNTAPYQATWPQQFMALLWRSWHSIIKEPLVVQIRITEVLFLSILVGVIYFRQDYDQAGVASLVGAIYWMVLHLTFSNYTSVLSIICGELPVLLREHNNGLYRTEAYFLAKQVADVPLYVATPVLFIAIFYYLINMYPPFENFLVAVFITILNVQAAVALGVLISSASPNYIVALAVGPTITTPLVVVAGYFQNSGTLPSWLNWTKYVSSMYYAFEAYQVNQWRSVDEIDCGPLEEEDCIFKDGEDVLDYYSQDEDNFSFDVFMLMMLSIGLRFFAYLCVYAKARRS